MSGIVKYGAQLCIVELSTIYSIYMLKLIIEYMILSSQEGT